MILLRKLYMFRLFRNTINSVIISNTCSEALKLNVPNESSQKFNFLENIFKLTYICDRTPGGLKTDANQ